MGLEEILAVILPEVAKCLAIGNYFTDIADLIEVLEEQASGAAACEVKKYETASRRFSFLENVCCPFLLLSNCEESYSSIFFNFTDNIGENSSSSSSSICNSNREKTDVREYIYKLYSQVLHDFDIFIDILTDKMEAPKCIGADLKSSTSENRRSGKRNSNNSSNNNNSNSNEANIPVLLVIEMLKGLSVFIAIRLIALDILTELRTAANDSSYLFVDSGSNINALVVALSNAIASSSTHFSAAKFSTSSGILAVAELLSSAFIESKIIISFINCLNGVFCLNYIKFVTNLNDYKSHLNQLNDKIIELKRGDDTLLSFLHYQKWFLWLRGSHYIYFNANKSYTEVKLLRSGDSSSDQGGHNYLIKSVIKILYHKDALQGSASNIFYMNESYESSNTYFLIASNVNSISINILSKSIRDDKWLPIFVRHVFVNNSNIIHPPNSAHISFESRERIMGGSRGDALSDVWPLVAAFFSQIHNKDAVGLSRVNNTYYKRQRSLLLLATSLSYGGAATYAALLSVGSSVGDASDDVVREMADRMQRIQKCLCTPFFHY